jgi:hypothetical protein
MQLETAAGILHDMKKHRGFQHLPEFMRQKWAVYDLYLQYANGKFISPTRNRTVTTNALRSLLNQIQELKGDKQGFGFSVRLIYMLSLLERGALDQLTEEVDAFKIYCRRYFPLVDYPKTRAFVKLIFLINKYSYSYPIIRVKAERYLKLLNESRVSYREANENIQIIPYTVIWDRMSAAILRHSAKSAKLRLQHI